MSRIEAITGFASAGYQCSALHGGDALWMETNCYGDVWIELLHALKLTPVAMLPFTVAVDFEGDQWTFFKPSHSEIFDLYGVDIQELTVWKPLLDHAIEHLSAGKPISTEADAFWLPDTSGTDYRRNHVKTTIILNSLDIAGECLGYFHNAGYHEMTGEDFRQTFRVGFAPDPTFMPMFAEVVRLDKVVQRSPEELSAMSWEYLKKYMARRPTNNPVLRFGARFAQDLPAIQERGLAYYHAWAFATTRQFGAAFNLLAAHLRWQSSVGRPGLTNAIAHFESLSNSAQSFILKGARAVNSKRPFEAAAFFDPIAQDWERGMRHLQLALDAGA